MRRFFVTILALVWCGLFGLQVALASDVSSPTGVVVWGTYTLDGTSFVVEWLPPPCSNDQDASTYSFQVNVFSGEGQGQPIIQENTHANTVLCKGASDTRPTAAVTHKILGVQPYQDYLVGVKSRNSDGTLSASSTQVLVRPGKTPKGSGEVRGQHLVLPKVFFPLAISTYISDT